jgi:nucleotide-binding universal stress UspA family protein
MNTRRLPLPIFQRILFAADFSESSREAFRVACTLTNDESTRLFVLHVIELVHVAEQPVIYGELGVPVPISSDYSSHHRALFERMKELYAPDHPVEVNYLLRDGEAADEILRVADEQACELIVMGTHGRTGLDRLLAGSVAEAVMRKAHCPVLTVRTPASVRSEATAQSFASSLI